MPFARAPGAIAVGLQMFAQHYMVIGNALARTVEVKERASRVQHGAAGHAYCARCSAGYMRVCKCRAFCYEAIQCWCLYVCIAQRANGVKSLVIGKKEENVGFFRSYFSPEEGVRGFQASNKRFSCHKVKPAKWCLPFYFLFT